MASTVDPIVKRSINCRHFITEIAKMAEPVLLKILTAALPILIILFVCFLISEGVGQCREHQNDFITKATTIDKFLKECEREYQQECEKYQLSIKCCSDTETKHPYYVKFVEKKEDWEKIRPLIFDVQTYLNATKRDETCPRFYRVGWSSFYPFYHTYSCSIHPGEGFIIETSVANWICPTLMDPVYE